MKKHMLQQMPQKQENHQELLQTTICQQFGKFRRNRFLDTYNLPKLNQEDRKPKLTNNQDRV